MRGARFRRWLTTRGFDQLAAHVPELATGRLLPLAAVGGCSFVASAAVMLLADRAGPAWGAAAQLAVQASAFATMGPFFWRRVEYRKHWGPLAYRNAFARHVLPGLPALLAAVLHTPLLGGARIPWNSLAPVALALGLYWLVTGFVLWLRSILTFGFDNLAMLYVYFPEEGRLVDAAIYTVIRHPAYAGVARMILALGVLRGTWASLLLGLVGPAGVMLWVWLVEEPELIARFGDSYREHRRRVPALVARPSNLGRYWRFLLAGR